MFQAFLDGTAGGDGSDDFGIFRGFGGAVTQIVRKGQPAPDGNGTLDIKLLSGFAPGCGDTFEILAYGSRGGVFDQINGHILSPVLALGQFYDDAHGVLKLLATAPGDANGDQVVDAFDFGLLAGNFNLPGTWETGDFDGSGIVDAFDFGLLAANFNGDFNALAAAAEALGITAIPEPTTAAVLSLLGLGMIAKRHRTA